MKIGQLDRHTYILNSNKRLPCEFVDVDKSAITDGDRVIHNFVQHPLILLNDTTYPTAVLSASLSKKYIIGEQKNAKGNI